MTGEEGGKKSTATLNQHDSFTALGYLKDRPYMWYCGTAAYRLGKADRERGWIELGRKLGISREYHFFLFIIVSTRDVHT